MRIQSKIHYINFARNCCSFSVKLQVSGKFLSTSPNYIQISKFFCVNIKCRYGIHKYIYSPFTQFIFLQFVLLGGIIEQLLISQLFDSIFYNIVVVGSQQTADFGDLFLVRRSYFGGLFL
eukprot:TRINITY_DN14727_c0_g1_i1.p3 TRINITY_DN14727_c0_g1~~TRINITY_DN14727_c0_g1_i1.p3  ORF type:complete len:120 (-),score=0.83 TRINITY_DN14727_c0_g1_i1:548-907(-)